MKRGDIVTVALQEDYGKSCAAVVIESDRLPPTDSVLVCLMTSALQKETPFRRHPAEASLSTGLQMASQVMVDKIFAVRRKKCGTPIGTLDPAVMLAITRKLALITGVADASTKTKET
jgi:mRNA interferase MazF